MSKEWSSVPVNPDWEAVNLAMADDSQPATSVENARIPTVYSPGDGALSFVYSRNGERSRQPSVTECQQLLDRLDDGDSFDLVNFHGRLRAVRKVEQDPSRDDLFFLKGKPYLAKIELSESDPSRASYKFYVKDSLDGQMKEVDGPYPLQPLLFFVNNKDYLQGRNEETAKELAAFVQSNPEMEVAYSNFQNYMFEYMENGTYYSEAALGHSDDLLMAKASRLYAAQYATPEFSFSHSVRNQAALILIKNWENDYCYNYEQKNKASKRPSRKI